MTKGPGQDVRPGPLDNEGERSIAETGRCADGLYADLPLKKARFLFGVIVWRPGVGERLEVAAFGGFGLRRPPAWGRLAQPEGGLLSVFPELDLDVVETGSGAMLDGREGLPVAAAQVPKRIRPRLQSDVGQGGPRQLRSQVTLRPAARPGAVDRP